MYNNGNSTSISNILLSFLWNGKIKRVCTLNWFDKCIYASME